MGGASTLVVSRTADAWADHDAAVIWRAALAAIDRVRGAVVRRPAAYVRRLDELRALAPGLPTLDQINAWLEPTGWSAELADGYVGVETYQELHARRAFPVCRQMRRMRDLEHSPTPDLFHDVVGHLPMLFEPDYRNLLAAWARLSTQVRPTAADAAVAASLKRLNDARDRDVVDPAEVEDGLLELDAAHVQCAAAPSRYACYQTFYTWAVEFGVVRAAQDLELIGAAALSSAGELARLASGQVNFGSFRAEGVGRLVNYTNYQDRMFVAEGFLEYFRSLEAI